MNVLTACFVHARFGCLTRLYARPRHSLEHPRVLKVNLALALPAAHRAAQFICHCRSEEADGNRTPVSLAASSLCSNNLEKCPMCVAALWLHSQVTDGRDLARIGTVIRAWVHLPEQLKLDVYEQCLNDGDG